jgi:hypothetical protein
MSGVHDHIRLRQHQISAIAFIGVRIRTGQVKDPGMTKGGEAMGGSSGGGEFSPGWSSAEMISDGRPDTDREVLVERVGQHPLPPAQAWGLWRPALRSRLHAPERVISTRSATSVQLKPRSRSSAICCVDAGCAGGPPRRMATPAPRSCSLTVVGLPRVFRTVEFVLFHAASCSSKYSMRTSWGVR